MSSSTGVFLVSTDGYMNLQLANTEDFRDGQSTGTLGEVFIRCNNVLYIISIDFSFHDVVLTWLYVQGSAVRVIVVYAYRLCSQGPQAKVPSTSHTSM
ncbi:hypothetical protein PISMIDRAFT_398184 [Pisolithus microcarpus 441]|uniref:Unplaced genomic scaffold scaffold_30, whole genome shotgun sequence n=1 Tax=Pisolithus microcarpus 441 TaxID=765257 RepID=A0A0C9ZFG5_9AGAM|nr:hypothetical protein PISMIDRAFT_398184 [Pisolithus microcarpus 441]